MDAELDGEEVGGGKGGLYTKYVCIGLRGRILDHLIRRSFMQDDQERKVQGTEDGAPLVSGKEIRYSAEKIKSCDCDKIKEERERGRPLERIAVSVLNGGVTKKKMLCFVAV